MNSFQKLYWDNLLNFVNKTIGGEKYFLLTSEKLATRKLKKYSYVVLPNTLSNTSDIFSLLQYLHKNTSNEARILISNFNFLWKPILDIAYSLGLSTRVKRNPNWLTHNDLTNILELCGYKLITLKRFFIFPIPVPILEVLLNKFVSKLPLIQNLCMNEIFVVRKARIKNDYSVSIIIPCRNEEKNIQGILSKIPKFGTKMEVIFVEGGSKDNTLAEIQNEIKRNKTINSKYFIQKGTGKGDAVRLGFSKAKHQILMILDADLTVDPRDLPKFYDAISSGMADFVNGSRLVYPMEAQAMQTLNYLANHIFGLGFSYILDQKIKDTLCGTKVLFKKDYKKISINRKFFGQFDPFGDFDLLFGACKNLLIIRDLPVRYKERKYGKTNISRFRHGLLLLKMILIGLRKLKFI